MISTRSTSSAGSLALRVLAVLAGAQLMWLGAKLSVNVGPVPITGQTLALPIVVAVLGTRQSVLAMLAYLAEGAAGLPVFSSGLGGAGVLLFAHSAEYLWALPLGAYAIGTLFDHGFGATYVRRWIAIFVGTGLVIAVGAVWLGVLLGSARAGWAFGIAPFIVGDLLKVSIAAWLAPSWPRIAAALRLSQV